MTLDDAWMTYASCRTVENPDPLFFPKTKRGMRADITEAKLICHDCSVRRTCLAYAIVHRENEGVWGGMSGYERRLIPRSLKLKIRAKWYTIHGTMGERAESRRR